MFNIICLETGEPERCGNDAAVYQTGAAAAAAAKGLSDSTGKRWQVRPVLDTSWRDREAERLANGTYTRLPWHCLHYSNETEHHYPHVSTKVPGNVAFTESNEKGARDLQTSMKPGRYLAKFHAYLGQERIKALADTFVASFGSIRLCWAETADEFEHVYTNGPSSCMSHDVSHYASDIHPVRVYAAGDISLAYLRASDGENETISGRVLVWRARKLYSRIYGDEIKLQRLLETEGYKSGRLDGARMLRVEEGNGFVAPYIDGSGSARDDGAFLIIDSRGDIDCSNTTGLSSETGRACECCGNHFAEDALYSVEGADGPLCETCESENTFYCEYSDERIYGDDYVIMANGQTWSRDAFQRHGFECEGNGNYYHDDDCVELADGTKWSQTYFDDHGFVCDGNGGCYSMGDIVAIDGSNYSQEYIDDHPELKGDIDVESAHRAHRARQGRDEHPAQIELAI